jgi:hypothetical protein
MLKVTLTLTVAVFGIHAATYSVTKRPEREADSSN